jgi:hypothetical protein
LPLRKFALRNRENIPNTGGKKSFADEAAAALTART